MARLVPSKIQAPLWSATQFSAILTLAFRNDNYAIGLYDGGRMGQMPGHQHGQAFDSFGPGFAFPNHQQSQSFQPSPAVYGHHHVGHVGGRQGVHPTYSG
jgi:hypothetical protein